jgi:hypothetical protein
MSEFGDIFAHGLTMTVYMYGSVAMIAFLAIVATAASKRAVLSQNAGGGTIQSSPKTRPAHS